MKHLLAVITVLILSACGGGGGGGPEGSTPAVASAETCATPQYLSVDDHRSAIVDLRFDHPSSDVNAQGQMVNSVDAVKTFVDRIKCVGFSTVILQTNTPIDPITGMLQLSKPLPSDFWRIVDYAKSKGLKVGIVALPVNYVNDNAILSINHPKEFFDSLATYKKQLAQMAETHRVDVFYVGAWQLDLDTDQYSADWDHVISEIRSVYKGKLTYLACPTCDNVVWGKVDYISMSYDPNRISADIIRNISNKYNKKITIDVIKISTSSMSDAGDFIWNALMSGDVNTITNAVNTADYTLQTTRITAVFALGSTVRQHINGVAFGEYMPWSQATWIQNAQPSQASHKWKLFDTLGFSLYNNISAQATLKQSLSQPFN